MYDLCYSSAPPVLGRHPGLFRQEVASNKFGNGEVDMITNNKHAWVWEIKPEYLDEYVRMHLNPWPEILEEHTRAGIRNYSIFQNGTQFIYVFECDDVKKAFEYIDHERGLRALERHHQQNGAELIRFFRGGAHPVPAAGVLSEIDILHTIWPLRSTAVFFIRFAVVLGMKLSIATVMAFSGMIVSGLSLGKLFGLPALPVWLCIVITLIVGFLIGLFSGIANAIPGIL